MPKIFAVLVGINNYTTTPLQGCINDVDAIEGYLKITFSTDQLSIKRLTDDDADKPLRANIINAFDHFNLANSDDICLFYYSGHGSFSVAPEEFWTDSSGFVQSFVCLDSRLPGGRDLMDKEMSYLIWKTMITKPSVTFVAITDCCHAGTITKSLADNSEIIDKMEKVNPVPTNLTDYLGFNITIDGNPAYLKSIDPITNKNRITVAQGRHIHIASSRDNQTSKELVIEGKRRSAFTYAMVKVLYECEGNATYTELVHKSAVQVKNIVPDQYPLINLDGKIDSGIQNKSFLFNEVTSGQSVKFRVYFDGEYGKWCILAGKLQSVTEGDIIQTVEGFETRVLTSPYPDFSFIDRHPEFETNKEYLATVARMPDKVTAISLANDIPADIKTLIFETKWTSGLFAILDNKPGRFIIRCDFADNYFLALPGSSKPINEPRGIVNKINVTEFFADIDTICKWKDLQEFNNPLSKLGSDDYDIELYRAKQAADTTVGNFEKLDKIMEVNDLYYKKVGEDWEMPAFRMRIINKRGLGNLFISYAYLGFDYKVNTTWFGSQEIAHGKDAWLTLSTEDYPTDFISMQVDVKYLDLGYSEITEYLKIFIGTEKINLDTKDQEGIELPKFRTKNIEEKIAEKSPGGVKDKKVFSGKDWKTELIGFRIIKPLPEIEISKSENSVIQGIVIEKHNLKAKISITASDKLSEVFNYVTNVKSIDSNADKIRKEDFVASPDKANGNSYLEPFDLSGSGIREGMLMDVLELSNVDDSSLVTSDNPLVIQIPTTKSAEEDSIIPIGYDTESKLYYPVGHFSEGKIYINTLPVETANDAAITQKSFFGSIKIYFQKVIGARLGFVYKYPRLAMGVVDNLLNVEYKFPLMLVPTTEEEEENNKSLFEKVEKAHNIIVFIHGIIGDTESILKCLKTPLDEEKNTLLKTNMNTVVLSFDYENLNTSIKQTASDLGDRLAVVGLKKGHTKNLIVVAHSMGGLVSRWFIEKLGGHEVVNKLVMLGTPNNGSNWSDVRDMADALLTYALNGASTLKPWMLILTKISGRIFKDVQLTLIEMGPDSDFVKDLNNKTAPEIPYIVIAGNTQKIIVNYEGSSSFIDKLFRSVKKKGIYNALDVLLFKKPNDIAVTDESIRTLTATTAGWKAKPIEYEVACDHLNYFNDLNSLKIVAENLHL